MADDDKKWTTTRIVSLLVPLLIMIAAVAGYIARPGFGTFVVAVLAFLMWIVVLGIDFLVRQIARGKRKLDRWLDQSLGLDTTSSTHADAILKKEPRLHQLHQSFSEAEADPALKEIARRATRQLLAAPNLMSHYESLLDKKLERTEITYRRYHDAGARVYEGVLRELEHASVELAAALAIPVTRARGSSADLQRDMRAEQIRRVDALLEHNETALAELSRVSVAVSSMRGVAADERILAEPTSRKDALADLAELADRAKKY